jgi:hypothetical protein
MPDENTPRIPVLLSDRDLSCIRWAAAFVADIIEPECPDQSGVREGLATSDVLMAIVSRAASVDGSAADKYAAALAAELGVEWTPTDPRRKGSQP